jgi:hypothetical protein
MQNIGHVHFEMLPFSLIELIARSYSDFTNSTLQGVEMEKLLSYCIHEENIDSYPAMNSILHAIKISIHFALILIIIILFSDLIFNLKIVL